MKSLRKGHIFNKVFLQKAIGVISCLKQWLIIQVQVLNVQSVELFFPYLKKAVPVQYVGSTVVTKPAKK
jgi:uncharacterized membrane protein